MEYHPIANIFPLFEGSEFSELVADIKVNGLIDSIITFEHKILDGRNRYRACVEAGVTPKFDVYDGSDPLGYVISKNLHRRHLTVGQRAMIAADLANVEREDTLNKGSRPANLPIGAITQADAAKMMNVSERSIREAKGIKESAPELIDDIMSGNMTINEARSKINISARREREIVESKKLIQTTPVIIQSDCMKIINDIDKIDLLLTDPPYFTDGNYTDHISKYLSKIKPTGQAYIFIGPTPKEVSAYLSIDTGGMVLEQILVWNYNNTGQRQPNHRYNSNYQLCLYFRGKDAVDINKPSDGTWQYACQTVNAPDGRIGDRWHEWQKPIELIERFIRNSSMEGDFVFDPFAGTGTTLIAASKLGRNAKGCDIDKKTIDICVERGCVRG